MAIDLFGAACIAVNQGVMYAVVRGHQRDGSGDTLLVLIKSEYPSMFTINAWSAISTTPESYFTSVPYRGYDGISGITCAVDKYGVFTLRFRDGTGYRYHPTAPKSLKTQTCSADSNDHGEWRRSDLIDPIDLEYWRRVIQLERVGSGSDINSDDGEGDEVTIYQRGWSQELPPMLYYARTDKKLYVNRITSGDLVQVSFVSIRYLFNTDARRCRHELIYSYI